jgi:hypothetical protein
LGLDRNACGAGDSDQLTAAGGDRRRSPLSRAAGRPRRCPLGAELGRVGIETEADLAAALFDERREPIRERDQGRFSP